MAVKLLVARGIGFNPGQTGFIVTHGLSMQVPVLGTRHLIALGVGFQPGSTKFIPLHGMNPLAATGRPVVRLMLTDMTKMMNQ